jgi:hypothetical protein
VLTFGYVSDNYYNYVEIYLRKPFEFSMSWMKTFEFRQSENRTHR